MILVKRSEGTPTDKMMKYGGRIPIRARETTDREVGQQLGFCVQHWR